MNNDQDALLTFLKVLSDMSRLRILGVLATRNASVEELAAALNLKPPTVSHHLSRLRDVDLVQMSAEGNTHIYQLRAENLRQFSHLLTPEHLSGLADPIPEDAWERKVLRDFLNGEELKEIPASRKKRVVILKWLANQFEWNVRYKESEVNAIIKRHHPDYATLRRELIGYQLLARSQGIYWRIEPETLTAAE
ncbi:metalloregulator ArsR/SmtB family transcription factor [Sulfobacillus thermosulfidooxidans]|uniref:metalloregulator ArsR/SmtB family transcription factor n=1 Tax=Sulfobacillus thermosulfidooxidans TaxID=28034 RepID=UPI00096B6DA5|nr:metalloregulator ArsR/SmtB family transcription factor [Sulfobacillus thermosulfidooxidans]OLZ10292.1 ArsR family transcriptional regulator [Sulfobacillus thermosulfidooxidans]OLZ13271.1 ArsR family transcriptional regulator [Sulfobacillus thermosulfidooxidans]OLZ21651.1 ArsR family transcriptional regulator [Sulfobacillus thermosulfidooxidans]